MPILRWLGRMPVMSLPSITMLPEVGTSKPATMRSVVVLPQPLGPETKRTRRDPRLRSKFSTAAAWALGNTLRTLLSSKNAIRSLSVFLIWQLSGASCIWELKMSPLVCRRHGAFFAAHASPG